MESVCHARSGERGHTTSDRSKERASSSLVCSDIGIESLRDPVRVL
jgi:hypothetical protein